MSWQGWMDTVITAQVCREVLVISVKRTSPGSATGCEPVRGSQLQVPGRAG